MKTPLSIICREAFAKPVEAQETIVARCLGQFLVVKKFLLAPLVNQKDEIYKHDQDDYPYNHHVQSQKIGHIHTSYNPSTFMTSHSCRMKIL